MERKSEVTDWRCREKEKEKKTRAQGETGNDEGKMENQRYMCESCPARRAWWRRRIGLLVSPDLFFAARFFGRPVQ
jgi:hypothetical protein